MFGIAIHNPYFEMMMAYDTTYLLLPSFCIEKRCWFFIFVCMVNNIVDFCRYTATDEMVPSDVILILDEF